jgi:hypothetical protein
MTVINRTLESVVVALMFLVSFNVASAQKITTLTTQAKGQGTITVSNLDKRKITSILVILKEDGTAELTFYADLQLFAQGSWSQDESSPQEIELKISGGIVQGSGTGTGKLLLRKDGKSIKKLSIRAKSADNSVITVEFVANNPPGKPT